MNSQFSCKAYLTQEKIPMKQEIRKFYVDSNTIMDFGHLSEKLRNIFPSLSGKCYTIAWKDADGDTIVISSNEELKIAVTDFRFMHVSVFKLYIVVHSEDNPDFINPQECPVIHFNVICDGCNKEIHGYRYKCCECPDYDLCSNCESLRLHSMHYMIRCPFVIDWSSHHGKRLSHNMKKFVKKISSHRQPCNGASWIDILPAYINTFTSFAEEYLMKNPGCRPTDTGAEDSKSRKASSEGNTMFKETSTEKKEEKEEKEEATLYPDLGKIIESKEKDSIEDQGIQVKATSSEDWTIIHKVKSTDGSDASFSPSPTGSISGAIPKQTQFLSTPSAPLFPEASEQVIYHPNPKIQNAVECMISMGFTNGEWLSQLLEANHGNISKALDVLQSVNPNKKIPDY